MTNQTIDIELAALKRAAEEAKRIGRNWAGKNRSPITDQDHWWQKGYQAASRQIEKAIRDLMETSP